MTYIQRLLSWFVLPQEEVHYTVLNYDKLRLHKQARQYLQNARQSRIQAQVHRFMHHDKEYEECILNQIDMLLAADKCRYVSSVLDWRD